MDRGMKFPALAAVIVSLAAFLVPASALPESAGKEAPKIAWKAGPGTADVGKDLAQVEIGKEYLFANAEDAKRLMEYFGNPPSNKEVGLVMPASDNATWFILFEYFNVGYVKDDEKDKIDADAILKNITEGTEQANKARAEKGMPTIKILGWHEKPHYDPGSHNLVWAVLAEGSGGRNVNYTVKLLGREGYVSAIFVGDPESLAAAKPEVDALISKFSYKKGRSYAEFVKGDKVAQYGLTALIAGGVGAAAIKMGLFGWLGTFLAKMWKVTREGGRIAVMGPNYRYCSRTYWDFADHVVALTHRTIEEHLYTAGFEPTRTVPRFLPYSFNGSLPASSALTAAYLRLPPAWRLFGKQFLVVARKPVGGS